MKKGAIVLIVVLVLLVGLSGYYIVASGFGNTNTNSNNLQVGTPTTTDTNPNIETPSSTPPETPRVPQTYDISIANFAFSPQTLIIHTGDTVKWTNKDSMQHTATANIGSLPDSGALLMGDSYSFMFNEKGTFGYHCSIHPGMTGKVIVQ